MSDTDTAVVEVFTLPTELPDNAEDLVELVGTIQSWPEDQRPKGSANFCKFVPKLINHRRLAEDFEGRVNTTWAFMHGKRSPAFYKSHRNRSLRSKAAQFYESLNAEQLRKHCSLYNLDYDAFEDVDSRIEALVAVASGETVDVVA